MKIKNMLKKAIDLHVHVGPDLIPRKFNVEQLARIEEGKLAGVCLKSHAFPTIPTIESIEESCDMETIGSVTLNNYVGGLNPGIIRLCAEISDKPIVVWFPTVSADNFLKKSRYEIPPEWIRKKGFRPRLARDIMGIRIINKNEELTPEARDVLKTIRGFDCILATGHLSWEESKILVEKAIDVGIKKVIITHPIYPMINMPLEVQKELSEMGAFIEQTYAMVSIDRIPIEKITKQIREIGADKCILSSDVGQSFSKNPSEALEEFVNLMVKEDIKESEIEKMLIRNPDKIIYRL